MKKKTFDCVQMKRDGAAEVMRRLDGMSPAQELEYWRRRTEEILERQRQAANAKTTQSHALSRRKVV